MAEQGWAANENNKDNEEEAETESGDLFPEPAHTILFGRSFELLLRIELTGATFADLDLTFDIPGRLYRLPFTLISSSSFPSSATTTTTTTTTTTSMISTSEIAKKRKRINGRDFPIEALQGWVNGERILSFATLHGSSHFVAWRCLMSARFDPALAFRALVDIVGPGR